MKISSKIESMEAIKKLKLNRFPEELFKCGEEEKVKKFINKYRYPLYAIRDRANSNGVFKLAVPFEKVLESIKEYNLFSINVSSLNYEKNQIITGEVEVLSNEDVYLTLSTNKSASARSATISPTYNMKTNIYDKKLKKIPGFFDIYYYIIEHNLVDVIVEFAYFDIPVGVNKEHIIIYEIRTEY